jgi:voltage-gated potassium channel
MSRVRSRFRQIGRYHRAEMIDVHRRLIAAVGLVVLVVLWGSIGFYWIGRGHEDWPFFQCVYMTVMTVTTVGYGEVLKGMEDNSSAKLFAIGVMIVGFTTGGFLLSTLTALLVEGDLGRLRRKKKMRKTIESLKGHTIVCGAGSTGRHVIQELIATETPFVAIDTDEERLLDVCKLHPSGIVPYIVGDATSEVVLHAAGLDRARGLVAALREDKDNLFVVISARAVNPAARIVARSGDVRVFELMRKAGANSVVSPNFIGGMRLASELLRPNVVEFLDEMLRDRDMNLRIEEVDIPKESGFAGKSLRESRIRDVTDALVLAIREKGRGAFHYNPGPDTRLEGGTTLVVLGRMASVKKLRDAVATGFSQ